MARAGRAAFYVGVIAVALGLPPYWASFETPWLGSSYPPFYQHFELLGLTGTLALFALAAFELRGSIGRRLSRQQAAAVFLLAFLLTASGLAALIFMRD